jgi:Ca2+-binding RTX toxin-like protein
VATCQGHTFDGGPGDDTVSYGRSDANLRIELGGTGGPPGCGNDDTIESNIESLEGSDGPDVMIGDSGENSFLGHKGADTFLGKGGADYIDAIDGSHDKVINCGGGPGDDILKDKIDPTPIACP